MEDALIAMQEKLQHIYRDVSVRGHGASAFLYLTNKGRAVEISAHKGNWWMEFWEASEDEDAGPVREMNVRIADEAVADAIRWLG